MKSSRNRIVNRIFINIIILHLATVPMLLNAADLSNCLSCHGYEMLGRMTESGEFINYYVDETKFNNSVHRNVDCIDCHDDITNIPHDPQPKQVDCTKACHIKDPFSNKPFSHTEIAKNLDLSVHGKKMDGKDSNRPSCKNCHTNQQILKEPADICEEYSDNCQKCHKSEKFMQVAKHLEFYRGNKLHWTLERKITVCSSCHLDTQKTTINESDFYDDLVSSYFSTFHGTGFAFGDDKVPVCSDCHGYHLVFNDEDERSTVHQNNLIETCSAAGCHETAQEIFIEGSMHFRYSGWQSAVMNWIIIIYYILIFGVIGFMVFHNLLDFNRSRIDMKRHPRDPNIPVKRYERMNKSDRISHVIMFVSFTALALTGSLLWIPKEKLLWLPEWLYMIEIRHWLHRIFAVILVLVSFYHIGYALFTKRGRSLLYEMMPRPSDGLHIFQNFLYFVGLRKEHPKMGMFNYMEKMEYLAFAWGSIVMTLTGIILWLEHLGPKFWVDVSRLIHSLEAILAVLAIIVWHFYLVHWKPGKWPMAHTWITGTINEIEVEHEHAGATESLKEVK